MSNDDANAKPTPEFSIVIGLVSTEDADRILETLTELRRQTPARSYEVLIGDRRQDAVSARIRSEFPEALVISAPADTALPALRTMALERARGELVIVTEDHCVPPRDWLDSMARAFDAAPPGTAAVGGCVENGVTERALDWATFLCEYSFFLPPVAEGATPVLPGMNVAYRRAALAGIDRDRLTSGFWETTVHPQLQRQGRVLYSSNRIRLFHCKRFSLRLFCAQRFLYSRYYAALRFGRGEGLRRTAALVLTPALPVVLLARMMRQCRQKRLPARVLVGALPALALFVLIWAVGEMVGYAFGRGDALARIE